MARIYGSVFFVLPLFFPAFQTFDRSIKPMKKNRCENAAFCELSPRVTYDKKTEMHRCHLLPMKKNLRKCYIA